MKPAKMKNGDGGERKSREKGWMKFLHLACMVMGLRVA